MAVQCRSADLRLQADFKSSLWYHHGDRRPLGYMLLHSKQPVADVLGLALTSSVPLSRHIGALHNSPRRSLIATAQLMRQQQHTACTTRSVES